MAKLAGWLGGWPLVGLLGCGPSSPLFLASPYVLTHVMLQFGPVSLCICLLSLVFQLAVHLHAGFYLRFAYLHSSEGFFDIVRKLPTSLAEIRSELHGKRHKIMY